VSGQVLGGGEAGPSDYIAQEGTPKIVLGRGRDAGPSNPGLQNAVQRFRGEILVKPS
jgi:hypothetical protein